MRPALSSLLKVNKICFLIQLDGRVKYHEYAFFIQRLPRT